jgi:DNA-directed RNA polymerase subunit M/transcription elongation factor TFIIS
VREEEQEEATEILSVDEQDTQDDAENGKQKCPRCHSVNIHYDKYTLNPTYFLLLILGSINPALTRKWKCKTCGYEWKNDNWKSPAK